MKAQMCNLILFIIYLFLVNSKQHDKIIIVLPKFGLKVNDFCVLVFFKTPCTPTITISSDVVRDAPFF